MQRINNLTIADLGANSPIYLDLVQNGLTVTGTTSLGANTTFINSAFGASNQSILEGVVSGAGAVGGKLVKTGNGGLTFANGANTFGTDGAIGLEVWASTQNTATGAVMSTSLTGTPFGVGDINLLPGTLIRLAAASNIANQKVISNSDAWGYSGVSIGYNNNGAALTQTDILSVLTGGAATDGKIQLLTTGSTRGVISLDNGVQYGALNIGAMETALNADGGAVERLWLGSMTSGAINQLYFAPTLGASTDGVYRLGGGGNQGTIQFGAGAFENVLTGATSVQIGALVGDVGSNGYNNQSVINGNTNITLNTRNNFTAGITANRGTTLNIGNNFALGSGTLTVNHTANAGVNIGQGAEGAVSGGGFSIWNNVDLVGDMRTAGNNFVLRGNVNLAPGVVGGTRTIENVTAANDMSILGVISGAGSNLIKAGAASLILNGTSTYTGTTTLAGTGGLFLGTDVLPNTNGALGNSNTPLLITAASTLGLSGQVTFGRDIVTTAAATIQGNSLYTSKVTGGISLGGALTLLNVTTGRLEMNGPITGAQAVTIGSTAASGQLNNGVVFIGPDANGFAQNTYTGGTTLQNARVVVGADSLYSGAPSALSIISSPFGTGALTFGAGNSNGGMFLGSDGANRVIANALAAIGTDADTTITFEGRGSLSFINTAAAWDIHSGGTARNRDIRVNSTQGVVLLDGDIASTGTQGANFNKTGGGILVIAGNNRSQNNLNTSANYGTSLRIQDGMVRVTADTNLGAPTIVAVGTGAHLVAGLPSDVQFGGGTLSVGGSFTTGHQFVLTAASGIEVSGNNTLTQPLPLAGAFGLTKMGTGTLVLNSTNANTSLTLGGRVLGGGTVLTQMTTGTPFGSGAITLTDGTLALQGTVGTAPVGVVVGTAQAAASYVINVGNSAGIVPGMTITNASIPVGAVVTGVSGNNVTISAPTTAAIASGQALTFGVVNQALTATAMTYNAGRIQLTKGTGVTSQLTATALTRGTNGLATLISSDLAADLGVNERFLTVTAQTTTSGILATPSIVGRASTGADTNSLNFLRYDVTNGFLLHNATTTASLAASAATSLADITGGAQAVANITVDVLALRTDSNITPTDGTSLLRLANGGLIMNGTTAATISSNLRFGTGATAQEALVFVSGGQTGASTISGNFEASDFTKGGAGTLLLSGTANVMAPITTGLCNLTIQEGTVRFAGQSSVPSGGLINLVINSSANGFDLNGQAITVGGLSGYGRVMNSGASNTLNVNTGIGQSTTFTGTLNGTLALAKSGDGTLTLNPPRNADGASLANTYSGGTVINAGRITSANAVAPVSTGTLAVRNTLALGTGPITLKGGILDLSALATNGYAAGEVTDNISTIQFGGGSGYNVTIDQYNSFGNGATYANTTSALASTGGTASVAWNLINNVTLNANALTWVGNTTNVQINGTLAVNAAGETTLNTGSNGVISGKIDALGKTLVKIGGQTLFLTNGDTGAGANDVGAWRLMAGTTEVRLSNGASNPLGATAPITLNGATLTISHEGDNTANMQVLSTFVNNNLTIGSTAGIGSGSYIGSGGAALNLTRAGSGSNKTVQFGTLAFGGPLGSPLITLANAADNLQLSSSFTGLTLIKDAFLTNNSRTGGNGNVTINGNISGNGTILKGGAGSLFINSDNSATFQGGYVSNGGTTFFGTFEGNVTTLSDTPGSIPGLVAASNYGTGNALIQPGSAIQFNSTANKVGSGSVDLRSNALANYGILRLAANAPLSDFNLLIGNLGGPQDTSYFGLAGGNGFNGGGKNAGSAIIALNTVYTQAIDLAKIGDGTAFLGSTTNGVGLNGSYNAATLGAGAGNIYRLGAGGSILYVNSDMVDRSQLTGTAALTVGSIFSGLNVDNITAGNGRGTAVLMTANNYTGATLVNRASVLEFRGSLTTSSFDTWGTLTAGGLGGTFTNAAGTAPLAPVTLRNTSELRFDNSTGLLATNRLEGYGGQGRWDDDTAVVLNNSTIRLIGNRDIEVTETIGDVTVGKFGQLVVQRDLLNRTVNLVVGGGAGADITRQTQTNNGLAITGNTASLQINAANGSQLGSDERIKLFSGLGANGLVALGGVTNGMVAPWIINGTDAQFLTYTADNGFVNAGFDGVRSGALGTTSVPTERTFINAAASMIGAGGLALDTYALRIDGDITFASGTPAATDRIQIRSGGLITNGNRVVSTGISFGTASQEANIYNINNLVIGTLATAGNTTGQITNATNIVKHGGGSLFIDAKQDSFSGNYIVNQGSIFFRSSTVQTNLGGTATLAQMNAGTNGLVVINNFGGNLGLRSDLASTVYNLGLVIGEGNPYAVINNDRAAGTANVVSILTGGIRFGGSPGEQGQTLFVSNAANNVAIQVNGPLVLSAATMEGAPAYNHIRQDPNLTVYGQVTGGATLVHSGGATLELGNGFTGFNNGINTFTGGIQNVQGTVNVRGTTTGTPANFATLFSGINNGGIGSGDITMYSGTLNLLIDGANTTTRERYVVGNNAAGNNLIINGSSTVTVNRNIATTAANKHLAFKDLTIGSSTLTTAIGNTYVLEINGATNLTGTPLLNIGGATLLNGVINDGAGTVAGTQGQAIIKGGAADLWLNSPNSTFGGLYAGSTSANGLGIVVNGGLLRFGDVNSENGTAMNLDTMLRGSTIRINPTGGIFLTNPANVNFGTGQVELLSSGSQMSLFRVQSAALNQAYLQNALSSNSQGVIALNASIANPLNLATIGNGRSFFGATANSDYTAETLGVGADNLYRIGGGGARLNFNSTAAGNLGVFVEGATPGTRVLFGNQASNGNSGETDTSDLHTYTGGTIISRSSSLLTRTATSGANGPLGNGGAVDIFGQVRLYSGATLLNFAGTANQYAVNLHPGGVLWLDNETSTQNRWFDTTPINLDGAQLYLRSINNAAQTSTEVVGDITFGRGASIRVQKGVALGDMQLTTSNLIRSGVGSTLSLISTAGNLGVAGNNDSERVVVTGTSTGAIVGGIKPAYYVNATDNTFVTYGANGFVNAAYSNIFAGGVFSTNTNANSVVDITTGVVTLAQDQTVYALRTAFGINSGVGQYNTLTFADGATDADRGGLITTGTVAIATNLRFGTTGTKEGIIYNTGNTTLSGDIYAGSLTKFGAGALIIGKDQTAAANGIGFSGNWTVNGGALTLNTLGASGNGGTITLNASGTTTGAGTTLNLVANPGSSLNGQYTMGRIIGVDNSVVAVNVGIADSAVGISDLESFSTDTTGLSPARLRVTVANSRSVLNAGTLFLTGTGSSIIDVVGSAVNNQITSGTTGTGLNVSGLNGSRDLIKWGNGYLWVGGNNTSFTGNVSIEQGALGITNANALVNAASITARRYGILDILTSGFTKTVTYEAGSIERWSVDNARSGTINLGAGSLQVNADQNTTTATIQINGGAIEGFLRTDDVSSSNSGLVFRTLGSGVSVQLLGNSFIGQNAFTDGPNGTDNGRTQDLTTGVGPDTNNNGELQAAARGAILEIKGNISGVGGLTKQSSDTVILSGTNTYAGSTNVANGTLRLGSANALPTGNNVTTSARGVLDLGGFNASIGNLTSSLITGTAFSSNGGFITNSATVMKTLTVTPTADSSYSGVVQNNVNVVKTGAKKLVFTNANTYNGETTVNAGTLEVTHVTGTAGSGVMGGISGTSKLTVANGATFNALTGSIGGTLTLAGTSGTVLELAAGSRLGVEVGPNTGTNTGSGAGQNTGSSIRLNSGTKALVNGNVTVDAYFLPGIVTHAGKSDILVAQGGGLVSTNGSSGTYSVGNLYNVTNFTVTGITASDTLVQFNVAPAAALTNAFWKGGFAGNTNVWAVSNGSSLSNWATDLAGTDTGLVPASTTNVFVSVTSPTDQNNMVLGSNMSINSLTLNATSGTPVVLQSTGDNTLTIGGAAAITSDVTSGVATFNNKIALTNATPTIAVNSTNTLTLAGPVSGAATSLTKTGTGTLVLSGANTYTGATNISAGILSAANDLALGTTAGNTTVANNGSLELQGNVTIAFETLALTGDGATVGADTSGGALRNLSGNNIVTGAITLAAATTVQSDAGTL
ncbi:MAG: autotransporter-associated beta strand repeat-containing protein, partial [Verrucomicrobia bacterium]|nr:autotransporter-associated beta strand repeat-containing protein [Verrucomicrobiota bacterium]